MRPEDQTPQQDPRDAQHAPESEMSESASLRTPEAAESPQPPAGTSPEAKAPKRGRRGRRGRRFDLRRDGKRAALVLVLLFFANLIVWYVAIRPVRAELAALKKDEQTAGAQRKRSRERLAMLRETRDRARATQREVESFYDEDLSTRSRRMVPFQRALGRVGEEFKVRPQQMNVNVDELEAEGIEVMAFNFPITGGYGNLRKFLARLESLDQFLIVREISLQGGKEGGRQLRLNVALETYFNAPNMRDQKARLEEWRKKTARRRSNRSPRR